MEVQIWKIGHIVEACIDKDNGIDEYTQNGEHPEPETSRR